MELITTHIAEESKLHFNTVKRILDGGISNPGIETAKKLHRVILSLYNLKAPFHEYWLVKKKEMTPRQYYESLESEAE